MSITTHCNSWIARSPCYGHRKSSPHKESRHFLLSDGAVNSGQGDRRSVPCYLHRHIQKVQPQVILTCSETIYNDYKFHYHMTHGIWFPSVMFEWSLTTISTKFYFSSSYKIILREYKLSPILLPFYF